MQLAPPLPPKLLSEEEIIMLTTEVSHQQSFGLRLSLSNPSIECIDQQCSCELRSRASLDSCYSQNSINLSQLLLEIEVVDQLAQWLLLPDTSISTLKSLCHEWWSS
jgi:hypothetical protein